MENKLIQSLISFYKEKGVDLHYLLDDPIFDRLPLEKKIAIIKDNATSLLDGTPSSLTKRDKLQIRNSGIAGALVGIATGVGAGMAAAKAIPGGKGKFNPYIVLSSALIGGTGGLATYMLKEHNNLSNRAEMHDQFQRVVKDPSSENALASLALRNMQKRHSDTAVEIIKDYLKEIPRLNKTTLTERAKLDTQLYNK